ncbi:carbon-nitrogen hydrolase family protein [Herbiconiux sp. L3-i23]|uniref:carbon-nitrogen hydrolase family protein n=1 Tax=Herbiconiux sp. L3-i23 TaxID=2905871 RepID=UPI00205AE564|nr:carbon-nitrogen hydrolase family protein [Herbiconiux sp. L3-i23]BDI23393.1 hydrolase [Herbiconiux sp. L3-i23]
MVSDAQLGVAVAQFAPGRDAVENLDRITGLATLAAERGAQLVVFPEYSSYFADPMDGSFARNAQTLDGRFVEALRTLATRLSVTIVAGVVEKMEPSGKFSNTLVAVDASGVVARYRKLHLYDAFGQRESDWVVPGDPSAAPEIFEVGGIKVGMQTCYDVRFPEVTRRLVDAGADLVLIPAEWVRGPLKEHHWRTLVTARAIENTIYVAAADHAPPVGVGNSLIVGPMGVHMVEIGEATDVAVAWISTERLAQVRAKNPALDLRRYRVEPA